MELLNGRGRALTYIAHHPQCTVKDMADGLFLTRRTIWGVVGELRRGHLIQVTKKERTHRYEAKDLLLRQTLFALAKYERLLA